MNKHLNLGVVGCGYWGPNLIRNLHQLSDCTLKTVCDTSPERLGHMRKMFPDVQGTDKFESVVNDPGLDALAIATPVRFHFAMAKASLMAGKHTFIEKPMTASVAEGEELVELAAQRGLTLMVGHTFLYSPAVRKIKDIIEWGDIGELHYIASRRLNLGLFQKDINVAWDLAPHDLSIILYVMKSMPQAVACWGDAHITPGIEDVTTMYLSFENNRCASVHSSWLDPRKVREMTFVGSRRMIAYDDTAPHEKIRVYDARVEVPPHYDTFAEFQYSYHYGDMYVPYVKQEEPLKVECQHFVDCIRTGRKPITSGQEGLNVVKILELASRSLKQRGLQQEVTASAAQYPATMPLVAAAMSHQSQAAKPQS